MTRYDVTLVNSTKFTIYANYYDSDKDWIAFMGDDGVVAEFASTSVAAILTLKTATLPDSGLTVTGTVTLSGTTTSTYIDHAIAALEKARKATDPRRAPQPD